MCSYLFRQEESTLGSPVSGLATRAKSGVAMADLSPRGAQHRKTGDDWWREELRKRGGGHHTTTDPGVAGNAEQSTASGGSGNSEEQTTETAVAENLLTSEERRLRAKEVEEYNKKLLEDQKNRQHRVLDLLTEWEHQIVEGGEGQGQGDVVIGHAEVVAGDIAAAASVVVVEPSGQGQVVDASRGLVGEGEGQPPAAAVRTEPPLLSPRAEASASNDALQTTATVVTLRSLAGKPQRRDEAEGGVEPVIAPPTPLEGEAAAAEPLALQVASPRVGVESSSTDRQPNEDEDVVEIEITRQDPVPTADGKGTRLVETKKMTIQVIVKKKRDEPSGGQPTQQQQPSVGLRNFNSEEGAASDVDEEDDELFFSQDNEAVLVPFGRCSSAGDGEEGDGGQASRDDVDVDDDSSGVPPEEQLRNVERELEEKMKAMAALRREVKRLKARREGFIRAARRTGEIERRSSECIDT
jgi:hypothetical protein